MGLHDPGFAYISPLSTYELVQTSVQTDIVKNVFCGTSGGTMINFDKIEIVNYLPREYVIDTVRNYTTNYDKIWIYNKVHHEINQYCSMHT